MYHLYSEKVYFLIDSLNFSCCNLRWLLLAYPMGLERCAQPLAHWSHSACRAMASVSKASQWAWKFGSGGVVAAIATPLLPNFRTHRKPHRPHAGQHTKACGSAHKSGLGPHLGSQRPNGGSMGLDPAVWVPRGWHGATEGGSGLGL